MTGQCAQDAAYADRQATVYRNLQPLIEVDCRSATRRQSLSPQGDVNRSIWLATSMYERQLNLNLDSVFSKKNLAGSENDLKNAKKRRKTGAFVNLC
jgi:stress response protein YsnF